MSKTVKNIIDLLANRDFLERAADDSIAAVKDKDAGYLKRFLKHRKERMDEIQNMVILGAYPEKEYHKRDILNIDKTREIETLAFFPWSILLHAVKNALEPIARRVVIYDSSAGMKGKGQVFAALRVRMFIRRYKFPYMVVVDLRKFYPSMPHDLVRRTLRKYIKDELFMEMVEKVVLDYSSSIEGILDWELQLKTMYCPWACKDPVEKAERGVTIGGSVSQIIGNLALSTVDGYAKRVLRLKVYHRHCDDIYIGVDSMEEGNRILSLMDGKFRELGVMVKHTSFTAPLKNEEKGIQGRCLDYCGYVFSQGNMRMRKRTKQRFARKLHNVMGKRRRREIVAAYWGIAKWGRCRNLMNTILRQEGIMSFKDLGIETSLVKTDKNGKRVFDVPEVKVASLADGNVEIVIHDFEDDITMKGNDGRCVVLFSYKGADDKKKFITTADRIIDKLRRARGMEKEGTTVFPQETKVSVARLGNGRFSYDIE